MAERYLAKLGPRASAERRAKWDESFDPDGVPIKSMTIVRAKTPDHPDGAPFYTADVSGFDDAQLTRLATSLTREFGGTLEECKRDLLAADHGLPILADDVIVFMSDESLEPPKASVSTLCPACGRPLDPWQMACRAESLKTERDDALIVSICFACETPIAFTGPVAVRVLTQAERDSLPESANTLLQAMKENALIYRAQKKQAGKDGRN